jgi:hypothetical protein
MEQEDEKWRVRFRSLDEYPPPRLIYGSDGLITKAPGDGSSQQVRHANSDAKDGEPNEGRCSNLG